MWDVSPSPLFFCHPAWGVLLLSRATAHPLPRRFSGILSLHAQWVALFRYKVVSVGRESSGKAGARIEKVVGASGVGQSFTCLDRHQPSTGSQNQHGVAVAIKAVFFGNRFAVGLLHQYVATEGAYKHQ